ncbi:hypothetical protein BC940DRAFT_298704 [Gongronella butleri]|nr:hypothetical protein BC940DRAFT_298704 [Gongronella butleri]
MSVNWVMLGPDSCMPVPLPREKMFFTQEKVKMVLDCSDNTTGYPGNTTGASSKWEANGVVTLSNQRIIFVARPSTAKCQSINIPITNLKKWKLEQPWFGANYIHGTVLPVPGGGMERHGLMTLTFQEGGAIEFTTMLRTLLERMAETSEMPAHLEPLPQYEGRESASSSTAVDSVSMMPAGAAMGAFGAMGAATAMTAQPPGAQPHEDLPPSYDTIN